MDLNPNIITDDDTRRFKRDDKHFVSTQLDDELVMMNIENGDYVGMENSALNIWELLTEPVSLTELTGKLMEKYDVAGETCLKEVTAFLNKLAKKGMLDIG